MGTDELNFYKNGVGTHSLSLKNGQLFLIKEKYPEFSISAWAQEKLTEKEIQDWIKRHKK